MSYEKLRTRLFREHRAIVDRWREVGLADARLAHFNALVADLKGAAEFLRAISHESGEPFDRLIADVACEMNNSVRGLGIRTEIVIAEDAGPCVMAETIDRLIIDLERSRFIFEMGTGGSKRREKVTARE